jgi:glycosyltransferase involved in cell wall biosynthesis
MKIPVTVIVPAKNEENNIRYCLKSVKWADQICVIDSSSTDNTCTIAKQYGAEIYQFKYKGGWPKKRQWAMENLPIRNKWILLLDADESVSDELRKELHGIVKNENNHFDGYWITLKMFFLGRELHHGASGLRKLSFFRKGKGRYEKRFDQQDASMADMEVHEHVVVDGKESRCGGHIIHRNFNTIDRYILKHNEYSNWASRLYFEKLHGSADQEARKATIFGNQSERRRFLKNVLIYIPGSPLVFFIYFYCIRLGFLDGIPGLIYCSLQAIQHFNVKAKLYELKLRRQV